LIPEAYKVKNKGTLLLRVCALLHNPKADGKVLNTNWSMPPTRLLADVNYFQGWQWFTTADDLSQITMLHFEQFLF